MSLWCLEGERLVRGCWRLWLRTHGAATTRNKKTSIAPHAAACRCTGCKMHGPQLRGTAWLALAQMCHFVRMSSDDFWMECLSHEYTRGPYVWQAIAGAALRTLQGVFSLHQGGSQRAVSRAVQGLK